jgi:lysophospholipase L1-like esterase
LVNLGVGLFLHAVDLGEPRAPDPRRDAVAHSGDAWADPYYAELQQTTKQRYAGFLGWRRADFAGEFIHVEDGIRRSYMPGADGERGMNGEKHGIEVFFFGGSTTWGIGNRDLHTIPSAFARVAEEAGIPVRVTNFGESGYVSWQEVLKLSELCALGDVPDLAVFYDGVNDIFVQIQTPTASPLPQNFHALRERFESANSLRRALLRYSAVHIALKHIAARRGGSGSRPMEIADLPGELPDLADNAATIYNASAEHARRIAAAYGFEVATFWQPCVYTKARIHPGEEPMRDEFGAGVGALYTATTKRVTEPTHIITDAFDSVDGPVMVDWCHTNEAGARAVAEAIFSHVEPVLLQMVGDGGLTRGAISQ